MPSDTEIHSFILKIWVEPDQQSTQPARVHGYITHVPTGERRYIQHLKDLDLILHEFLPLPEPGLWARIRRRLRGWHSR